MPIPTGAVKVFCEFAHISYRPRAVAGEAGRGIWRDCWVIFGEDQSGWTTMWCSRPQYAKDFEQLVSQFLAMIAHDAREDLGET